jgi:hypothetical protein
MLPVQDTRAQATDLYKARMKTESEVKCKITYSRYKRLLQEKLVLDKLEAHRVIRMIARFSNIRQRDVDLFLVNFHPYSSA